jgi:acyl carrier protein
MTTQKETVLSDILEIVESLAADWDYEGQVTASTRLFSEMNWQSVDMVVLAHEIQTRYQQNFPFADFFESLREGEHIGVSISEVADFVFANLGKNTPAKTSP